MENTTLPTNSDINIAENETEINEKIVQFQGNAQVNYKKLAIEKIDKERNAMAPSKSSPIGIMYIEVANALRHFCQQDELFAQILYQTKRTFADCMEVVAKNSGRGISDIDAYRRAIQFYFPNSQIEFLMQITIEGDAPDEAYINQERKKPQSKSSKPKNNQKPEKKVQDKPKADNKTIDKTAEPSKEKKQPPAPTTMQLSLF